MDFASLGPPFEKFLDQVARVGSYFLFLRSHPVSHTNFPRLSTRFTAAGQAILGWLLPLVPRDSNNIKQD